MRRTREHTVVAWLIAGSIAITSGAAGAETCVTTDCHPGLAAIAKPHQPVKDGDCLACHTRTAAKHPLSGGKSFALVAGDEKLCTPCHEAYGKMKVVHGPVKGGACLSCHKPHGSSARYLLESDDQTALCLQCHDALAFKQHYMHGPVAVGACTSCHAPHESAQKGLLKGEIRDLCLKCHADFAKAMKAAGVVHPPVKDDPCTSCHNPHGSAFQYVLKKQMPDLCYGCHDTFAKKLTGLKVPHKPLQQAKSCSNCHSSHFSNSKGLLPSDQKKLCLECHSTDGLKSSFVFKNISGVMLKNMKTVLEGDKNLHGPLANGTCTGCHNPHGSNTIRLLNGNYPPAFYASYTEGSYDLCLSCHEKNLLKYAETSIYTKFRNGKQNLHYLHVSDKRKGRSCRACHEPHAADGPKLIGKDGSTFGDWKVPIRFTPTPTGGSCAPGCHRKVSYDREAPVVYTPSTK